MAILLYADDILLIASSVTSFQMLLHICDHELSCIDMSNNATKSSCLRIGDKHIISNVVDYVQLMAMI